MAAALISGVGVSAGEGLAAGSSNGGADTPGALNSVPGFVIIGADKPLLAEVGSQAGQDQPAPADKKTYDRSPDSVIQMLKASKAAAEKMRAANNGFHFTDNFTMSVEGVMANARLVGDIMPPDKARMAVELHLPFGLGIDERTPGLSIFDLIVVGENVYAKPSTTDKWLSFDLSEDKNMPPLSENAEKMDFTEFIVNPEFLGEEKTPAGARVYHIRFEIDAAKVIERVEKDLKPNLSPTMKEKVEQLKKSVVADDVWLGVNDLLPYQVTERFVNTDLQIAYDEMMMFYNWGQQVEIAAPPAENTVDCTC